MNRARRQPSRGAFDLIEEAVHLLRTAPAATLAAYYLGAIPFVLGLLYFWTDMSSSPFAYRHSIGSALGVAALFLWMKFWQANFACRLRAQIAAEPAPRWTLRQCGHVLLTQTILQPFGLFLIPLSLIPILPFPWVYGFYQNVTVLANDERPGTLPCLKRAWQQAGRWPGQNCAALAILSLFGFYVLLNWVTVGLLPPQLAKMLLGVQSVFSRDPAGLLNPIFFAGTFGLTYLCVDPILKGIYTLRCFYGDALRSGEDLKAGLKPFQTPTPCGSSFPMEENPTRARLAGSVSYRLLCALFLLLAILAVSTARAGEAKVSSTPSASRRISPSALDRAIARTIHQSKYTWRMPYKKIVEPDANEWVLSRFLDRVGRTLRRWARAVADGLWHLLKKLFRHRPAEGSTTNSGSGWIVSLEILLYGLIAVGSVALLALLFRVWRGRRPSLTLATGEGIQQMPDLGDEATGPEQLPGDRWMALARACLERGELRPALRAFYLASLSHLASRHLITLARFKSNREYERELRRRGHAAPDLLSLFNENLPVFERIWYGMHEINRELVDCFAARVEAMRSLG